MEISCRILLQRSIIRYELVQDELKPLNKNKNNK